MHSARMPKLADIVAYCDQRIRLTQVKDFDGATMAYKSRIMASQQNCCRS